MSAGARKSSATANSLVHIALSTVTVSQTSYLHSTFLTVIENSFGPLLTLCRFSECTYDQPSNRRRNPAPQYVEALENRLRRAEDLLKTVFPDVDLGDPNLDLGASQRMHSNVKNEPQPSVQQRPWVSLEKDQQGHEGDKDSMLESMVANTGSLDLDDEGHWDFHGHSSGRVFLRRMREQFGALVGKENPGNMPFKNYKSIKPLDSPKAPGESPIDRSLPITHELPDKHCAHLLCKNALDDAGALLRLEHRPTFLLMFDRVYDTPVEEFGDEEIRFVPLLYSVIALGTLFAKAEESQLQKNGYDSAIDQGWARTQLCSGLYAD